MYRTLLLFLLSTHAALGAPQEKDSSITYLKIQPPSTDRPADTENYRSYRIVPSNKTLKKINKNQSIPVLPDDRQNDNPPEPDTKLNKPLNVSNNDSDVLNLTESIIENASKLVEIDQNEPIIKPTQTVNEKASDTSPVKEDNPISDPEIDETKDRKVLLKDTFENLESDPSETSQFDRHSRDYDYTTASYESSETESADVSTEKYEDLDATKSSASISPKFSYYQKFDGSFSANLIETSGKRRFRSRCRCEKIWNCPKLQITVPRCPEEYFMCCF